MHDCNTRDTNKPVIHLSLNQVGLILRMDSGVIYWNQTGNVACMQRCAEGVLVLPTDAELVHESPIELYKCPIERGLMEMDWRPVQGIDEDRASAIDALLQTRLTTASITVDRSLLSESEEAWIYVDVVPTEHTMYSGFGTTKGILVWQNSD